jgi:hypothetical protein
MYYTFNGKTVKIYSQNQRKRKRGERRGKERKGKERRGKERKGKERKGKERKGKERKGKERKGKERIQRETGPFDSMNTKVSGTTKNSFSEATEASIVFPFTVPFPLHTIPIFFK